MLTTANVGGLCPLNFHLDQACLEVHSLRSEPVDLWHQYDECYLCDEVQWVKIPANQVVALLVDSAFSSYFYYINEKGHKYCTTKATFAEYGSYIWNISDGSCPSVQTKMKPPAHFFLPIVVVLLVYGIGSVLACVARCVYAREWSARVWLRNVTFSELANDLGSPQTQELTPTAPRVGSMRRQINTRILSLDTFRGICIAMMIFVNYGGGQYRFFRHTPWNGMTVADVIFPWFLWVMGMSLVLSLRSQLRSDRSRCSVWFTVLRRSVILMVLGLLLNSFGHPHADLSTFRYCGVLQRIGASYLIVATIETIFINLQGSTQYGHLSDLVDGWVQWVCAFGLVGVWMMITFIVNVPNCGAGYLGPGGMHRHGQFFNCTGGAAGYLDRLIIGPNHMYNHSTCKNIYQTAQPYDPEGLLGTLTAAFLVHMGVHASRILLCFDRSSSRMSRWMFWGCVALVAAGVLCGFSKETGRIPINKNLFSLSFVLLSGGIAYLVFAFLYYVVDYKNWWSGCPFNYAGMNAILLYIGHEITKNMFPWSWKPVWGTHGEHLAMNLIGTSLWILIAFFLYRKKFFVSI